jgi:hypothetical protein
MTTCSAEAHLKNGKTFSISVEKRFLAVGPHGTPTPHCYIAEDTLYMRIMKGNGVQKQARLNRLKNEIIEYVSSQPQCSAADIVDHLSNERKMRNHGLTARKVGFFIPRYLSEMIGFTLDNSTGKRLYHLAA